MRRVAWRGWPNRVVGYWRGSLQLRTAAFTVLLSSIAVGVIVASMSVSIGSNLFDSRRDQVLAESNRAAVQVQLIFDGSSGAEQLTTGDLDTLRGAAQTAITRTTSTGSGTQFALVRTPGQDTLNNMQGTASTDLVIDEVISAALRETVAAAPGELHYQSVTLPLAGTTAPGIVVGAPVNVPTAGQYELYLVFNLADVQRNLTSVQQILAVGGFTLVAMIGGIAYYAAHLVVAPVRRAAEASQKLAAGHLEERIPEHGEDVIATLARSFNGMADSLQRQITQLADLSRVQQRFVSDVSHELRTPLTTIRLAGDVLYDQRDGFPATTARTAELLHTQVQRFESLLADLLEMSRYDAGAVQLDTEPTNLVRLVDDALDGVQPLAAATGTDLRLVAPGGWFEADVDARRVRRILINLLGNAIDHGEGKPIDVFVDSNESAVAIAVRDYGVGMPPQDVERVFDRFWRADPSRQRTTGGTGLGLAIAQEDARLHGGALEVWSEPGNGTCFRLTLPRRHGEPVSNSPLELPPELPLELPADLPPGDEEADRNG